MSLSRLKPERFARFWNVICGRLRCDEQPNRWQPLAIGGLNHIGGVWAAAVRLHSVPAALHVKLPTNVALISVHAIHGMIPAGPSWPSHDDANRRTVNLSNTIHPLYSSSNATRQATTRAASTLRTTRRRELASTAVHSQFHIPNCSFDTPRFHVLRCVLRYGPVSLRSIDQ